MASSSGTIDISDDEDDNKIDVEVVGAHVVELEPRIKCEETLQGKYKVLEFIDSGVVSQIYKARELLNGKEVALKVSYSRFKEEAHSESIFLGWFRKEAREKNIVNLLESFSIAEENGQRIVMVMPFFGPSIFKLMQKVKKTFNGGRELLGFSRSSYFKSDDIRAIGFQLATALEFLHSKNIVHCDLKPENIVFEETDPLEDDPFDDVENRARINLRGTKVRLIDFNTAVCTTECPEGVLYAEHQTRNYRAPETFFQTGLSSKADIWSYGCVLLEMHEGDMTFQAINPVGHIHQVLMFTGYQFTTKYLGEVKDSDSPRRDWVQRGTSGFRFEFAPPLPSNLDDCPHLAKRIKLGEKNAENFLRHLYGVFAFHPDKRLSAKEVLDSSFYRQCRESNNNVIRDDDAIIVIED